MSDNGKILAFPDMAALDAEAAAWVARFDAGDVSAKDQAAFQAWLNSSALHRQAIAEYGSFWSEFDKLGQLTASIGAERDLGEQAKRVPAFSGTTLWLQALAASFIALVRVGGFFLQEIPERPSARSSVQQAQAARPSGNQSYATAIGGQKKFTLADGTVVTLNTNSRIDVELRGNRRDVHLVQGEAYFDVVHDKARPFTVYANNYVVRDIGTAFAVHLLEKGLVNVRVTKGSVEISASVADKAKSLGILEAGRDVVFGQKIERSQVVSDAELGRKLAWRQGQLIYSGQPLSEVLADISRYSDIEIELADPALGNLPVGGAFSVNQTDAIFAALENNFGVHAEWLDARHVRLTSVSDKDSSGR